MRRRHLPRGERKRACCESMRANDDDRDCPGGGSSQEHRVGEVLLRPLGMNGGAARASTPSSPSPAPTAARDARREAPGRERDDRDRAGEGEHGSPAGRKDRQSKRCQGGIRGHLKNPRNCDQRPVRSWRKSDLVPHGNEREEAGGCDRIAKACVPDRRHRRDADLDHRPADRPAQYQERKQNSMVVSAFHAAFRLGSHASALNWSLSGV